MIIATIYFEIKGRWVVVKDKVITQKKKYVNLTMQRTQQWTRAKNIYYWNNTWCKLNMKCKNEFKKS